MHITGERRVPAPRERVWRSLTDTAVLRECLPGGTVEPDGEGGLMLAVEGGGQVRAQPSIREQFSTLGWRIDPTAPGSQLALIRLVEQGVFTLLHYEVSLADPEGIDSPVRTENLRARIDQTLGRFIHAIAGPGEIGAGGIANAVQAATEPSAQPSASVRATPTVGSGGHAAAAPSPLLALLNPSVIGGVLFLIVVLFVVGLF